MNISLIVPLGDNSFHMQIYHSHTVPIVKTALCNTLNIDLKNSYSAIRNDEKSNT